MIGKIWRALLQAAPPRFWAMLGAAIALSARADWLIYIVAFRVWKGQEPRQLDILGKALWLVIAGILLIVLALTMQRVSASGAWGSVNVGSDAGEKADGKP